MIHLKSIAAKALPSPVAGQHLSTKASGDSGEAQALAYLAARGLILVRRNFKTPGRGGGEVDLIMRTPDGCLVFVEVRKRTHATYGGAAASITAVKKQRIILAAQHFISQLPRIPPCRFDVVTLQGDAQDTRIQWLPAAFDASEGR